MTKLKGVSLFSNVGIAEAKLNKLNVEIVLANEIDERRAKFYKEIYPETDMILGDITKPEIRTEIILKAINYDVDFIMATPPCQGMSVAGKRDPLDERNQLISYGMEVIKAVEPKFILLENVPRQLVTDIKVDNQLMRIPDYIKYELGEKYNINEERMIKAMDHNVPQMRERNIFLLVRKDLGFTWEPPKKKKRIPLKEAFKNVPSLDPLLREGEAFTIEKFPDFEKKKEVGLSISKWHYPPTHSWKQVKWMMHTPSAKSAIYNEKYFPIKDDGKHIKAHHNHYRRLNWETPGRTLTQNNGVISSLACVHPGHYLGENDEGYPIYSDPRVLSIYELLILSSLPLDWPIPEWANERFIRQVIGEGIPSTLVYELFKELKNLLKVFK